MYREKPYKRLEIVFAEGLRAATHQQGVLDSVRTRATTLTAWRLLIGDGPASHGRAGSRLASSRHPDRHAAIRNLARRRMHAPRHERLSVVVPLLLPALQRDRELLLGRLRPAVARVP